MKNKLNRTSVEIFQGREKKNNYFEGWYFKCCKDNRTISFIPSISISDNIRQAFIQVVTNEFSKSFKFEFPEFTYSDFPFYIKVGNNYFSKERIKICIEEENFQIRGEIHNINNTSLETSEYMPNIMGPFAYINFLECYHGIISLHHELQGKLYLKFENNENVLDFNNGVGYIEKDWGTSFPKTYLWCQANSFKEPRTSLFFSIADIPIKQITFKGFICVFMVNGKQYRFATYNFSKIKKIIYLNKENCIMIIIKKQNIILEIKIFEDRYHNLIAPDSGEMRRGVKESVLSKVYVKLLKNNKVIYEGNSDNTGLEIDMFISNR